MSTVVPLIPATAPFTPEQRAWLNGFFAGVFSRGGAAGISDPKSQISDPSPPALQPLTILFGSQTGTAEGLAKRAAKEAGRRGFAATVLDMAQTGAAKLAAEKHLLVITSTYGDGEPPDNAKALHTALATAAQLSTPGSQLPTLRYSVCSLGDTNYTHFCKCGADFDHYLEKLGATRVAPRVDCDLEYEQKFAAWLDLALSALSSGTVGVTSQRDPAVESRDRSALIPDAAAATPVYSRQNPFPALLRTVRTLNAPGSSKQVQHVEFDLNGSDLTYEAGDALGVMPHNCPALVTDVLAALGCDGEEAVPAPDGSITSLRHALTEHFDLGKPTPELLALIEKVGGTLCPDSSSPSGHKATPTATASLHRHIIDVLLTGAAAKVSPVDFVRTLKRLQPRLYSISSSPKAHAGQVHLTVGAVRYELNGRSRKGVCSTFLADRTTPGESRIPVYVHTNRAFRLPPDSDTAMIMIGPGTGIAPFRAFLHERQASGARGRNWLFFGDQRAATDFLYRDELAALQRDGVLTRLDTAFSRDQADKIYVQHRMVEHAAELYAWLEGGAHLYVCGDASRMARDVDAALHTVIQRAGGKTAEQAAACVRALTAAKRYARDVY